MTRPPNDPRNQRNWEDRARIRRQATDFVWAVRLLGIDAAAIGTIHWSRRHVLDVALELADRHVQAARAIETDIMSTSRSEQHRARMEREEATWTIAEARAAHTRYRNGERSPHLTEGHRVHLRRQRRARGMQALAIHLGDDQQQEQTGGDAA